jgi:hypothetical protein
LQRFRGEPWNKRKLVGQTTPLSDIWGIRVRLQLRASTRNAAAWPHTKLESTAKFLGIEVADALRFKPSPN